MKYWQYFYHEKCGIWTDFAWVSLDYDGCMCMLISKGFHSLFWFMDLNSHVSMAPIAYLEYRLDSRVLIFAGICSNNFCTMKILVMD